jgi:hypothetical protein
LNLANVDFDYPGWRCGFRSGRVANNAKRSNVVGHFEKQGFILDLASKRGGSTAAVMGEGMVIRTPENCPILRSGESASCVSLDAPLIANRLHRNSIVNSTNNNSSNSSTEPNDSVSCAIMKATDQAGADNAAAVYEAYLRSVVQRMQELRWLSRMLETVEVAVMIFLSRKILNTLSPLPLMPLRPLPLASCICICHLTRHGRVGCSMEQNMLIGSQVQSEPPIRVHT